MYSYRYTVSLFTSVNSCTCVINCIGDYTYDFYELYTSGLVNALTRAVVVTLAGFKSKNEPILPALDLDNSW